MARRSPSRPRLQQWPMLLLAMTLLRFTAISPAQEAGPEAAFQVLENDPRFAITCLFDSYDLTLPSLLPHPGAEDSPEYPTGNYTGFNGLTMRQICALPAFGGAPSLNMQGHCMVKGADPVDPDSASVVFDLKPTVTKTKKGTTTPVAGSQTNSPRATTGLGAAATRRGWPVCATTATPTASCKTGQASEDIGMQSTGQLWGTTFLAATHEPEDKSTLSQVCFREKLNV